MTKLCFKCRYEKDLSAFYKHGEMADGHFGKCKECAKKDAAAHRKKNIEKYRAYDRERALLPHRKKLIAQTCKKYKEKYPLRYAANCLLNNAIQAKKIKKPKKCSVCNKKARIMGHHEDYYKPLEVIWVCQICHKKLHN